jgi:superfamily II DNA or RNA helicase
MRLRNYQVDAVAAILREFEKVNSTLVVCPTGTGKTVLIADLIKKTYPGRTMFLAHRDVLIYQAKSTIENHAGVRCDIEMAEFKAEETLFGKATAVISTVQTQIAGGDGNGRMMRFDPGNFDLLILDEAHHYTSPGWRRPLEHFRKNPKLKVVGLTATPDRADEQALGQIFESVAYDYEIQDAIKDGWLVPVEQQFVTIAGLDYSHVRITAGDLNGGDLAKVMEAETICQGMVGAAIEIVGDEQFVFFTASVAHAEMVSNIFNRHRAGMCEWVCESTPKRERQLMLERYNRKETQGLANCGILTEGWDNRTVSVCFMGRPTRSRSLYAQQAGRILRPLDGVVDGPETPDERRGAIEDSSKPFALIVDFVGNSGEHKLVSSADILGGNYEDEAIDRAVRKAKEEGRPVRMDEMLDKSEAEIRAEIEKRKLEEEARKARLVAKVQYQTKVINPFDVFALQPTRSRGWDKGRKLSEKQRNVMMKQGIDPNGMEYHEAKQILDEIFRRFDHGECSFKQARLLRKKAAVLGKDPAALAHVSRAEASALIDIISYKEGWA